MANGQPNIQLSKRELQVLEMVATGATNQEIAHKLVISVNTVKVHMRNIFEKMGVQSRTEASMRAIQEGLVAVPDNDPQESDETDTIAPKSYLLETNLPLVLPRWQQIYLLSAALAAVIGLVLPLLPQGAQNTTKPVSLPVIYAQPPTPTPPIQAGADSTRWAAHQPMPTSRAGLALVAIGKQIFAIGGVRGNNQATRLVEIYDTVTNRWTEGASKPTATANIAGAVLDGKIYVPGGCTNAGKAVDSVGIYDPKADRWTQGSALPGARCGYGLVVFQDNLYLFGGWDGEKFMDTVFVFSPQTNEWEATKFTMPRPLGYAGTAVLGDAIYLVGGYDGQTEFNQTYQFTPQTGDWLEKSPLQAQRGGLGLVSTSAGLYAIGGGWEQGLTVSEKYDPTNDIWTTFEAPYASQWRNLGLTVVDTKIYAIGGWDGAEDKFKDSVVSYQFLYQFFLPLSSP